MISILISITRTLSEGWGGWMEREKRLGGLSEKREREKTGCERRRERELYRAGPGNYEAWGGAKKMRHSIFKNKIIEKLLYIRFLLQNY